MTSPVEERSLTFMEKVNIVQQLVKKVDWNSIAEQFETTLQTIYELRKNFQVILETFHYHIKSQDMPFRSGLYPRMENILFWWYTDQRQHVTNEALRQKAKVIIEVINERPTPDSAPFSGSKSWAKKFKVRFGLTATISQPKSEEVNVSVEAPHTGVLNSTSTHPGADEVLDVDSSDKENKFDEQLLQVEGSDTVATVFGHHEDKVYEPEAKCKIEEMERSNNGDTGYGHGERIEVELKGEQSNAYETEESNTVVTGHLKQTGAEFNGKECKAKVEQFPEQSIPTTVNVGSEDDKNVNEETVNQSKNIGVATVQVGIVFNDDGEKNGPIAREKSMSIVVEQSSTSIIDLMEVSDDDEVMLEPKKKRKLSTFTTDGDSSDLRSDSGDPTDPNKDLPKKRKLSDEVLAPARNKGVKSEAAHQTTITDYFSLKK